MEGAHQNVPSLVRLLRRVRSPIVHFHTGHSCLPNSVMLAMELLATRVEEAADIAEFLAENSTRLARVEKILEILEWWGGL